MSVTVIMHLPEGDPEGLEKTLQSLRDQTAPATAVIALGIPSSLPSLPGFPIRVIEYPEGSAVHELARALREVRSEHVCYLDNRAGAVVLKGGALDLFTMAIDRHPAAGMVYGDYEVEAAGEIREVGLLDHHPGRLRDNQDYGRVLFIRSMVLERIGGLDPTLSYQHLYDLRLRIGSSWELIHLANKTGGALYRVLAPPREANVFDYLLADREEQEEAEAVLNAHLKRIGAYLQPGQDYRPRPQVEGELAASVIIPVNRRPEFIGTAIESVWAQTVPQVEVLVVVNGGREDPTCQAVERYQPGGDKYDSQRPPVRLLVVDINNIGYCLNLGLRQARGEFYLQLDSDDRLKPRAVEMIRDCFRSDPLIGMVIGSYEVWESASRRRGGLVRVAGLPVVTHQEWTEANGRNNLLRINGAGAPRAIPIAVLRELGWFGVNDQPYVQNYGEDYDLVLRISERYRIGRIYEPLYEVLRHPGGTDHSIDQERIDLNDNAKDWMRREALLRRQKINSAGLLAGGPTGGTLQSPSVTRPPSGPPAGGPTSGTPPSPVNPPTDQPEG